MQVIHLGTAVILGIVIPHIFSISTASSSSDCSPAVDDCLSNLCKSQQAFHSGACGGEDYVNTRTLCCWGPGTQYEECLMKGLTACNLTIQTTPDQFPSLRRCVCNWEEELCGSIQVLATQCHQRTAVLQKRSTESRWQSSTLIDYVPNGAGSCLDRLTVCVSDAVCNKYLVPVLHACTAGQCYRDRCRQAIGQFYGGMPHSVAEMLVMCECEASDQVCVQMKTALHSGTCGDESWICQETVVQCVKDETCREILKTFQSKCWSFEEEQCNENDFGRDGCLREMDPGLILGADPECKIAFLATLGTVLHSPCSCRGVHNDHLLACNRIHDVLHNRSRFMTSWQSNSEPLKPPKMDESGQNLTLYNDYVLYAFATVLLVGVVILMPLALVCKLWMLKRSDEKKFHPLQKSNCVVIL